MNNPLENKLKVQIQSLTGFEFQDFVKELFKKKYGGENFTIPPRTKDGGADGIITFESGDIIVACYGPGKIDQNRYLNKINDDFGKFTQNWQAEDKDWMFVTNHIIPSWAIKRINELNQNCKHIGVENLIEFVDDLPSNKKRSLYQYLNIEEGFYNYERSYINENNDHEIISCEGYLLDKNFKPSLLLINVIKYFVYDRYSRIKIWIGESDITDELNKIEEEFSKITEDRFGKREWNASDVKELKPIQRDVQKAKFVRIKSETDFKILEACLPQIKQEKNLIVWFNHPDISASKLYAFDLLQKLRSTGRSVPVLIEENIYSSMDESPTSPLSKLMGLFTKHINNENLLALQFPAQNNISDEDILEIIYSSETDIRSETYNLICTFGHHTHVVKLIKFLNLKDDPLLLFSLIKTDLYLSKEFLQVASKSQLNAIAKRDLRDLYLLLIVELKYGPINNELNELLDHYNMTDCEEINIIRNKVDFSQLNKPKYVLISQILYPGTLAEIIKSSKHHYLNTPLDFVLNMIKEHTNESLITILENEDLRVGFNIINEYEISPQIETKFNIQENLYINEI